MCVTLRYTKKMANKGWYQAWEIFLVGLWWNQDKKQKTSLLAFFYLKSGISK